MDKLLKVIVALSAVDKMSSVINQATKNSISDLDKLKKASSDAFGSGSKMLGAGVAIAASLAPAVGAFADLEDSTTRMKTLLMDGNGSVGADFEKMNALSIQLGNRLPGTTADFQNLFSVMVKNGLTSQNVLNGVGEAAAYLAVNLKMPTDQVGELAARMKIATGVADNEMLRFMDILNRVDQVGVKADDMSMAFQRSAGSLKLLGIQGITATEQMSNLYAQLIRATGSGERVGTGFKTMLSDMLDPKKYTAMKEAAAAAGVSLKMFDNGKFLGVENMIQQFDKLKNLSTGQKAGIAKALTGGGGDSELMLLMINNGVKGYRDMNQEFTRHASLSKQVNTQLSTLRLLWEATTGTITNMMAALGAGLAPELKAITNVIGRVAGALQQFLSNNPAFAKFVTLTVGAIGVFLSVVGFIKLMKSAFIALRVVMMANPFILIATVAIMAIALIYSNWGKITAWFKRLWDNVKKLFIAAWQGIKFVLLNFTPVGLIFNHWDKITSFFTVLFGGVRNIFSSLVEWVYNLAPRFFNAGANIVKSIWNGIKSLANKPVEAIANITKKMRDFLPFSPAKEGAFKDLHRVKIVETIASTIKPAPMVRAIQQVTSQAGERFGISGGSAPKPMFSSAGGGSTISLHFAPNISGGNPQSVVDELRKYMPTLLRDLQREIERQDRKKYA